MENLFLRIAFQGMKNQSIHQTPLIQRLINEWSGRPLMLYVSYIIEKHNRTFILFTSYKFQFSLCPYSTPILSRIVKLSPQMVGQLLALLHFFSPRLAHIGMGLVKPQPSKAPTIVGQGQDNPRVSPYVNLVIISPLFCFILHSLFAKGVQTQSDPITHPDPKVARLGSGLEI